MRAERLFSILGLVDPELVEEAMASNSSIRARRAAVWGRYMAIAACCVIVCGASMISDTLLKEARERHVSLLRTEKHIHEACHALILSLPAERLMVRKVH